MVPSFLKKHNYKMKIEQRKQPAWAFNTQQRQTYSTNLFQTFKGFSEFTSPSLLQKIQERRAAPAARAPQGLSCTSNEPELPPALQRLSLQPKGCTKQGGKNIKLPARGPKPSTVHSTAARGHTSTSCRAGAAAGFLQMQTAPFASAFCS